VKRIISIVGARPQFVKAAVVSRAFAADQRFQELLVHTGQHHDDNLSDIFFRELDIPTPAHHLGIAGGGHGAMTGRMLEHIETVLIAEKPDAVLVYGDTNSTLAGALAAVKLHLPVIHVEAGLRSFDRRMPEEINRVVTDHVSSLLLCPTPAAVTLLANEGITKGVFNVGDVMYDATLFAIAQAQRHRGVLERLGLQDGGYSICTLHRAESTDDPAILRALLEFIASQGDGKPIVFPVHPRTRKMIDSAGLSTKGLMSVDPVGYFEMHALLGGCALVLTDSGGLQKEAYFHRKPCITLRNVTEWNETVSAGWNRIWQGPDWITPRREISDFGDGHAGDAVVARVAEFLAV
jgi:UDP-GlcNAc3NAcA epimerase